MRHYKAIVDGYILAIGRGSGYTEINDDEYNEIMAVIRKKPLQTGTTNYRLREDLTWEPFEREPDPDPEPTIEDKAEAYDILMGVSE